MNTSVLRVALVNPHHSSKYLVHQTDKHPLQVQSKLFCEIVFPKKKIGALLKKMHVMDRLKLLKQGSDIFLEHFQLFRSSHSIDLIQITYSDL